MRFLVISFLAAHLSLHLKAEFFWGLTTADNRLFVATNEAILLQKTAYMYNDQTGAAINPTMTIIRDSSKYDLTTYEGTFPTFGRLGIAGPCEVVISTNSPTTISMYLSFSRLTNSSIRSILLRSNESETITVPPGSSIHFLDSSIGDASEWLWARIGNGISEATGVKIYSSDEFEGPLEITLFPPDLDLYRLKNDLLVSYYFTKNAFVVPLPEVISAPTGSFTITVESGSDFTNWFPDVFLQKTSDEQKYYRLKVEK